MRPGTTSSSPTASATENRPSPPTAWGRNSPATTTPTWSMRTLAYQKMAPTREQADKLLDERLAAPFTADANDYLYQWEASGDYDAAPGLARITATLLAINAADDERNPPETGLMEAALKQVKNGRLYLIPASEETRGHGTTGMARFYQQALRELLQRPPVA